MAMPYSRINGDLDFNVDNEAEERIQNILGKITNIPSDEVQIYKEWAELLEYSAPHFKRAALDIEVFNEGKKIPSAEAAVLPVLTVCFATNEGERIALILSQGKEDMEIPDNITKTLFFSSEVDLLKSTFEHINKYPFLVTFNGDDFDLKYLYKRAIRLGIPKEEIPIIIRYRMSMIRHGIHIDLYKFFFIKAMKIYAFKGKYKNVDLDSVAKALIKRGKIPTNIDRLTDLSYHDLVKYCMNDAEITLELTTFNNDLVMSLITVLTRISRMPMENVTRKSISSWIYSFMINEHIKRGFLIPTPSEIKAQKGQIVSEAVIKGKKYKGAIVFEPVEGTHFDVVVLDFASLYPTIIKVYNIGYSTINCPHEECKKNTIGELSHWICTKNKALESLLIGSLRDLRVNWYKPKSKDKDEKLKQWYSVAEQSIKVIMNASYGVFGAESFPLYCPPVAEEITAIARHVISETAKHAQSIGIKVLYGDTDSIFIIRPSQEKLEEIIKWTEEKFGIDFEIDKVYRYVCLSGRKKNYFGVKEDGTVDVKGLTGKKKHTPKIIRDAFDETKKILSEIHGEQEISMGKMKIVGLVRKTYNTFRQRSWSNIGDLAFNITMNAEFSEYKKTMPQHVKAALMLKKEGYDISAGSVISFIKTRKRIKTKTGYRYATDVKPVELAKKTDVDVKKYIAFLKSTFEQILDPLNISFNEDILGLKSLEDWLP
mgnify:CR=1 FL=1